MYGCPVNVNTALLVAECDEGSEQCCGRLLGICTRLLCAFRLQLLTERSWRRVVSLIVLQLDWTAAVTGRVYTKKGSPRPFMKIKVF